MREVSGEGKTREIRQTGSGRIIRETRKTRKEGKRDTRNWKN